MADFADRKCEPCEGGAAPLTAAQAGEALRALHEDWDLNADGKAISAAPSPLPTQLRGSRRLKGIIRK
jgi:hypothetical protein